MPEGLNTKKRRSLVEKSFCFISVFLLLLSVSSAENVSSVRILCTDYNYSAFQDYAAAGHDVNFRNGSINDIATALASRDPDIDVLFSNAFWTGPNQEATLLLSTDRCQRFDG